MGILFKESFKYKLLTLDELIINLDRLSRFKLPELCYNRVFYSVIQKNLIYPKLSQAEIEKTDFKLISNIVKTIWNLSVDKHCKGENINYSVNKALKLISDNAFINTPKDTKFFINTKLKISPILSHIDYNNSPYNLKFLIKINNTFKNSDMEIKDLDELRKKYSLKFPIKKLIIVEGITEEILLPVFASKLKHDFEKEGIYIIGSGGKSKSPSLYLQLKNRLKIPVNILFDSDAAEVYKILKNNLLKKDNALIIENGEFEDILSLNLIKRALNKEYLPATPLSVSDLTNESSMCENIRNFYRTRHLGEYKKSKVSKIFAKNIKYNTDLTDEIKKIITYIT